ncbi:MAG TPA: thiamine pyrophosphate-binding protein [Polyangiaceae bacterium]|nr:thiamine pyrophosphate-binding protein [Polyangiaceae bacterium]
MLAADFIAERLVALGIRHVFGVGGANIEDLFVAVQRRRPAIAAVLCKHEHGAGTAADGYARITGRLGVVLVTSGGGAMNLVHALAEARASHVPLLALVGEPPTELQGRGAFQDTSGRGGLVDARAVYAAVTKFAARVEDVGALPELLAEAIASATTAPAGPAVLLLAKDRQRATLRDVAAELPPTPELETPSREVVEAAASTLGPGPVVVIAGDEVARHGARAELAAFVEKLAATVAVTPDGRDAFDNRSPVFLGVAGSMGHPEVLAALSEDAELVVVGTRLPLLARQGLEGRLRERVAVSLGDEPPFAPFHGRVHLGGDLRRTLPALARSLAARSPRGLAWSLRAEPDAALLADRDAFLDSQRVLAAVDRALPERSVVLVDAGNSGAAAAHLVRVPAGGRWLLALGMAGMGYTFGAAVGAALASGRRCTVLAGDGAFFMHGFEVHTALEHRLPITYVVLNNRAHGMCLVRERLLLKTRADYNEFGPCALGAGLGMMLDGLTACDCSTLGELEAALERANAATGPVLIGATLAAVDVPPFAAFQEAGGAAFERLGEGRAP